MTPLEERIKHEEIPLHIQPLLDVLVKTCIGELTGSAVKIEMYFTKKDEYYYAHICYEKEKKRNEFTIGLK